MINPAVSALLARQEELAREFARIRAGCAHQYALVRVGEEPRRIKMLQGQKGVLYSNGTTLRSVVRRCGCCLEEKAVLTTEACPHCLRPLEARGQGSTGYSDGTDSVPSTQLFGCPACPYVADVEDEDDDW